MTEENLYKAPESDLTQNEPQNVVYAGFWIRVLASIIDAILMSLITYPLLMLIYGTEGWLEATASFGLGVILISYVLPAIIIISFWVYKSATPGKMVCGLKIINFKSGGKASIGQLIGRYFGYYLSAIPLGLGYLWVAFDKKKRGWHDKVSKTAVVKKA